MHTHTQTPLITPSVVRACAWVRVLRTHQPIYPPLFSRSLVLCMYSTGAQHVTSTSCLNYARWLTVVLTAREASTSQLISRLGLAIAVMMLIEGKLGY